MTSGLGDAIQLGTETTSTNPWITSLSRVCVFLDLSLLVALKLFMTSNTPKGVLDDYPVQKIAITRETC